MRRSRGSFWIGLLMGILILPVLGFLYLWFGYAPVATAGPPLPLEKTVTRIALQARIHKEAPAQAPVAITDANLIEGARLYRRHCSVCHGLIGQADGATAKGMFPKPPQLFKHNVTDDPVGETYWKIENGIRLTGMPAYKGSLSEDEIWKIALMLAKSDKLPDQATDILKQPLPAD